MLRIAGIALCILSAAGALAGAREHATITMPEGDKERQAREEWGYADAVLFGDTAYISGVVAVVQEGETTPEKAYQRMFERIAERLGRIGCSWDDVVEMTSYHTDIAMQLPFVLAAKRKFIHPPYPAWTAVGVTRLIPNNGITEIKLVAKACSGKTAKR